ncbi:MAG: helix-turn-helix domain-containing protein [Anaerolineae bacterium]
MSIKQTADTLHVTPAAVTSWLKRINEQGPAALLQLREPANKFPDLVRYIVQRLRTLSPHRYTQVSLDTAQSICYQCSPQKMKTGEPDGTTATKSVMRR